MRFSQLSTHQILNIYKCWHSATHSLTYLKGKQGKKHPLLSMQHGREGASSWVVLPSAGTKEPPVSWQKHCPGECGGRSEVEPTRGSQVEPPVTVTVEGPLVLRGRRFGLAKGVLVLDASQRGLIYPGGGVRKRPRGLPRSRLIKPIRLARAQLNTRVQLTGALVNRLTTATTAAVIVLFRV